MSDLTLVIGNKNYSSWSLRPWLLMRQLGVPFEETLIRLYAEDSPEIMAKHSPSRRVPVLRDGSIVIWDSLAIIEYLAERFPDRRIWPEEREARARARSICAEMHSGFFALRDALSMNIRKVFTDFQIDAPTQKDIDRITAIWRNARQQFGGDKPFLFGDFSAADAFFAPVVWRFRGYNVPVDPDIRTYMDAVCALPAMQEWEAAARAETWVIEAAEA